ncbi:MAG: Mov34/MPN/PAD-1 family protein [Cyclobacteriaceae bacterium]|nr:Mov34/MPN/PAD-1 family protein [Cyclobacteriaceae bacterium]
MNFQDIKRIKFPMVCIETAYDHIRQAGSQRLEGVVLFAGTYDPVEKVFHVLETIVPKQVSVNIDQGLLYAVDGDELHRINVHLHATKQTLVAQLHSHPSKAYHSSTDDAFPIITKVGGFSIVVPNFGMEEFSLDKWVVYRLNANGFWEEVGLTKVTDIIEVI